MSCRALGVSQAWFYKWRNGDRSLRHSTRAVLAARIDYLFAKHHGSYGSPRITADLRELGWRVGENTVARVMAEQGLVARRQARPPVDDPAGQVGPQGAGRVGPGLQPTGPAGCDVVW